MINPVTARTVFAPKGVLFLIYGLQSMHNTSLGCSLLNTEELRPNIRDDDSRDIDSLFAKEVSLKSINGI